MNIIKVVKETSSAFFVFKSLSIEEEMQLLLKSRKISKYVYIHKKFKNYSLIKSDKNPVGSLIFDEYPRTSLEKIYK